MNENTQPNLKSTLFYLLLLWTAMILLSAVAWSVLPADQQIPVHWGLDGKPDRYGGKLEGLGLMPGIAGFLLLLFWAIPKIEPRRLNLEKSLKAYKIIIGLLMTILCVIHAGTVFSCMGYAIDLNRIVTLSVGVMFIGIGNVMGKIRSNFFMGIRTPWTLSSELSWRKTHRLGGWLFVGLGLFMLLAGFIQHKLVFGFLMVGIIAMVVVLFVYSYLVWKKDPDRQKTDVK
jgi:uncharacterized membrane protein